MRKDGPMSDATTRSAWGHGLATLTEDGTVLDTWYPAPALGEPGDDESTPDDLREAVTADADRGVRTEVVTTVIDIDAPPATTPDAYLRLHLLSHRLVRPNE